jgi:predicted glutamine amidotransferase
MCRFVAYLGCEIPVSSLITEPENSLINQSIHSRERKEPLNGDGFGVAWYVPTITDEPAVFKDITPAWNNINLLNLARVTKSSCIFAHVRAATPGLPVIQLNCHPFASGPFSFMHNGLIGGFKELRRSLLRKLSDEAFQTISGSTDSEYLFALFLDHFARENATNDGKNRLEAMKRAIAASIREVEGSIKEAGLDIPTFLNIAVTDGTSTVVTRHSSHVPKDANSLYVHANGSFLCKAGHIKNGKVSDTHRAVVIASEPLGSIGEWRMVEPNVMVAVGEDLKVELLPLDEML